MNVQHLEDIEIPDIEITEGWVAREIATLDECDDAFAYLSAVCASIDFQMDMENLKPEPQRDGAWLARARCALRYKKAALAIVQTRRNQIGRQERQAFQNQRDRVLLEHIKATLPAVQFAELVRGSGVAELEKERDAA